MDISDVATGVQTTDLPVVTTAETLAVTADAALLSRETGRVLIEGWIQFTTAANTTSVKIRIRRGAGVAGTLVGEANIVAAAASVNVEANIATQEDRVGEREMIYSLTIEPAGASANGSIIQSFLKVTVLG